VVAAATERPNGEGGRTGTSPWSCRSPRRRQRSRRTALAAAIEVSVPDINVKVENREGGSGARSATRTFLGQKGKARTLLATETALLALPVSGNVQFTHKDFTPIMKVRGLRPAGGPSRLSEAELPGCRRGRADRSVVAGVSGFRRVDNIVLSLNRQHDRVRFDRVVFESGVSSSRTARPADRHRHAQSGE